MNKPAQTDPTQTVSVSVAASMLHVSEKTIRRRIKAGELAASKQPLDGGGTGWRVQIGSATETEPDNGLDNVPEPRRQRNGQRAGTSHAQTATALDNAPDTMDTRAGTELDTRRNRDGHEELADRGAQEIARQREEILFLRGLVEQRDRDAAELRASLRAALAAMPKQLPPASTDAATPPRSSPEREQSPSVGDAATPTAKRRPRPLWRVVLGLR